MVLHGDDSQAMNIGILAQLRRLLPTRACQFHGAPHLCGDLVAFQANGLTYADSSKPLGSETEWHIRTHGAFKILHDTLGIQIIDVSSHQEVWIHLLHVKRDWLIAHPATKNSSSQA